MRLRRRSRWVLLSLGLAVVLAWLLLPEERQNRNAEANALLASALQLLDQSASETDPEIQRTMLQEVRHNLDRIVGDLPGTYLGERITADDPLGWIDAYAQFLALGEHCVRAITEECVLALAVQVAEEMLTSEAGFDEVTASAMGSPFTDIRRHPVVARRLANELLQFVSDRDIWFQSQNWLTSIAVLRSLKGDLEGATAAIGQIPSREYRSAALQYLVEDIARSLRENRVLDDVPSRSLALELTQSALVVAESFETPSVRDRALLAILRAQIQALDISGVHDTIGRIRPGRDLDRALESLMRFYSAVGDIDAAVAVANGFDSVETRSQAIRQIAEAQSFVEPDRRNAALSLALEDLTSWMGRPIGDKRRPDVVPPRVIANVARAYAALGEMQVALELIGQLEPSDYLTVSTIVDVVRAVIRTTGDVDFAIGIAVDAETETIAAQAYEQIAWELVHRGDLVLARTLLEEAEAIDAAVDWNDQPQVAAAHIVRTWAALGEIDRALTMDAIYDGEPPVLRVGRIVNDLVSEGAIETARDVLVRSVELRILGSPNTNDYLVESVRAIAEAQLDAGDNSGAQNTVEIGRSILLRSDYGRTFWYDFLVLAGLDVRLGNGTEARELLTLATGRLLSVDSPGSQLSALFEIAILMGKL